MVHRDFTEQDPRGLALALALAMLSFANRAAAEPWMVVPVVVGMADDAQLSASRASPAVGAALTRRVRVIPGATARERFEAHGSSEPVAATHSDLDHIARDAQQALYHVAMGLYRNASYDVERVMERAERALESLNRESLAARQLLDACLFIVRARLQERKGDLARKQALECRRLVPDIEPDASMHPPIVIGELAAAEAALEQQRPGSLRVSSQPAGCPVFIQGRNLGQTPLELPRLSPGEYRVQVECIPGQYGRVHRVTLGQNRAVLHVDSQLDTAVHTAGVISLRYASEPARNRLALAHASEVARAVGAARLALLWPEPGSADRVRIAAVEVRGGRILAQAIVRVNEAGDIARGDEALAALLAGRSFDWSATEPVTLEAPAPVALVNAVPQAIDSALAIEAEQASPAGDAPLESGASIAAWAVAGVGVAAHLTGWALYVRQLSLEEDYRKVRNLPDGSEARRRLGRADDLALYPPLVAGAGALLTTASLWFVLPERAEPAPPAWAYVVGGGGLALAGAGAFLLVHGAGCDDFDRFGRCDDVLTSTRFGAMLLGTALPLLSVPLIYFLRTPGRETELEQGFSATVSDRAFSVHWGGTL